MKKVMNECMTYEVGFNIMDVLVWGCLSACFFFFTCLFFNMSYFLYTQTVYYQVVLYF